MYVNPSNVSICATVGAAKPVVSGFGSTITSLNDGEERRKFSPLALLLSKDSVAFVGENFQSPPSVSSVSFSFGRRDGPTSTARVTFKSQNFFTVSLIVLKFAG